MTQIEQAADRQERHGARPRTRSGRSGSEPPRTVARNGECGGGGRAGLRCLGAREPRVADRPVRHRAAVVRLRRPARDRAGAAGLGHRHHRAARRQVAAGATACRASSPAIAVTLAAGRCRSSACWCCCRRRSAYWLGRATRGRRAHQAEAADDEPAAGPARRGAQGAERRSAPAAAAGDSEGRAAVGDRGHTIFSILTPAVSQFILFIGALVFYLVYQKRLRSTASIFLSDREARLATLRTLSDIDEQHDHLFRHVHHRERLPRAGDRGADLGWWACPTRCCGACWPACSTMCPTSGRRSSPPRSAWSGC